MMVQITVLCRHCESDQLVKDGFAPNGEQKYRYHACGRRSRENLSGPRYSPLRRADILRAYQERPSRRGIVRTFGISRNTLIKLIRGGLQCFLL